MIRSILMGITAGARSMTPLAVVTLAARGGRLPANDLLAQLLGSGLARAGATTMALGELGGDKMESAPDRVIAPGMAARMLSAGIAGAALAEPERRVRAALLSAAVASGAAWFTWKARCAAMERWGQTRTGLVEDAVAVGSAVAIAYLGREQKRGAQVG